MRRRRVERSGWFSEWVCVKGEFGNEDLFLRE